MEVSRDRKNKVLTLTQYKYTTFILNKFNKENLNPVSTPVEIGVKLNKNTEQANKKDINLF
jgi:hypothetical protein